MTDTALNRYLLLYITAPDGEPWSAADDDIADWLSITAPEEVRVLGERLTGIEDARMVSRRAGEVTVTDGPFPEFKEWFAGFDVVLAPDVDAAVAIGSRHPSARYGRVLVLPLMTEARSDELYRDTLRARRRS